MRSNLTPLPPLTTCILVYQGSFYTAYAAAVTAALCKTKGLQDQRDATLLSGCLTTEQAEQAAEKEGLTLGGGTRLWIPALRTCRCRTNASPRSALS